MERLTPVQALAGLEGPWRAGKGLKQELCAKRKHGTELKGKSQVSETAHHVDFENVIIYCGL